MDVVRELHSVLSRTSILFFVLLGIWGLIRAFRSQGVGPSYLGALVIGEGIFIVQTILGVILVIGGNQPARVVHFIYGAFAVVAIPGLFALTKGDDSNQTQWYYTILVLFLTGVAFRAIGTAV